MKMLSHAEARAVYDRFGARQDRQSFYEDEAFADLLAQLALNEAQAVCEFGCGTGRLAKTLLDEYLPATARYVGVDSSTTMVALAKERLAPLGARAKIIQTDGAPQLDLPADSFDRFISTYVLDLLSEADIQAILAEAQRILSPGALLGVASLTHGNTLVSRLVEKIWVGVHTVRPTLVGGCRPISLLAYLSGPAWHIRHRRHIISAGISSEVVVAERL
ncbi:MAG: class I SAM-dependent methyltransferase [Chloroflexi bacterium]|nr:class I SAM-dependent methyltransferase [Chloroflexota bacterium]